MTEAAEVLGKLSPGTARLVHRAGTEASITAWHQTLGAVNQFGWIMLNSSGGPRQFSISGGGGIPANLPRGRPAAVAIIHSFSAADPLDASTIAGRWLENGAFVYFGAMNEPYLPAFRTPRLVASLAAGEMPLGRSCGREKTNRSAGPGALCIWEIRFSVFPPLLAALEKTGSSPQNGKPARGRTWIRPCS